MMTSLEDMMKSESGKYGEFWKQFGRVLKEGVSFDFENKDRLLSLYLFESSYDGEKPTTLKDYVSRMKETQSAIYYLTGPSRRAVEHSPHLEAFQERGYEVLYLVDAVDELLIQGLPEFDGKNVKSVGKGTADLGEEKRAREAHNYAEWLSRKRLLPFCVRPHRIRFWLQFYWKRWRHPRREAAR